MKGRLNNLITRYEKALVQEVDQVKAEMLRRVIGDLISLRR